LAGAPIGNQNKNKAHIWESAVSAALEKRGVTRRDALAELWLVAYEKGLKGDLASITAIWDREMGKPGQTIEQTIDARVETFDLAAEKAEELRKRIRGEG
jgi:hypothetical protein